MDDLKAASSKRRTASRGGKFILLAASRLPLAILFLLLAARCSLLAAPPEKTLTLTSESTLAAKPDLAVVTFYFTAYGWTVNKAQTKVDQIIKKFLDKLARNKVVTSQVTTGNFKLKPSYQFNRDLKTHVPSDFLVSREVSIRLEDLSSIGRLMDSSLSVGSFLLEAANLTVKDKPGLSRAAFEKALEEGKRKAEAMAKAIGAKLGAVLSIEELGSEIEEVNLIQGTELASLAAGTLQVESQENPEEKAKEENQTPASDKTESSTTPSEFLQARSRLRIVFALQ